MNTQNNFTKRMKAYETYIRFLDSANFVFLDEINNFEFKKISKYNKSKELYNKITNDFKLVNELINKQDLLNAATILRTLYENIIYIIATSYNKELNLTLDTEAKILRAILENNCNLLFTTFFEKEDFNAIYKYLCKLVHPSSMKELLSYMENTIKYKKSLIINLKYIMLIIEYMYLNFLNKRIGNKESKFDLNFIKMCTYINLVNIISFVENMKNNKNLINKYFYYDADNKYIIDSQKKGKDMFETLISKKSLLDEDIKELGKELDTQIKESKYKEKVDEMLNCIN